MRKHDLHINMRGFRKKCRRNNISENIVEFDNTLNTVIKLSYKTNSVVLWEGLVTYVKENVLDKNVELQKVNSMQ